MIIFQMTNLEKMWLLCMTLLWHTLIANCNYQTTCPKNMQKLNALPGHGWDSIRNKNMKNVLEFTYNKCRTTEDGKYLIPDNIIAINESGQHITSEFIGHYMNYSSGTSESFVTNVRLNNVFGFASVQGSCDIDLLEAKKRQVNEKSKTTRVQAHNNMYAVQSIPDAKIDPKLKSIFDRVIDATESNNFEKAQSLCQYIVRDYGTHYIDHTHAGAVLLEEDYISSDFVSRNGKRHILAAAGAIFSKKFKSGKISVKVEDQFLKQYEASRTSFNIRSIGGAPITPNTTVENWIKNIGNNIVVIDRSGKPLPFLLSPEQFPNVSLTTLNTVKNQLDQVIKDYYSYNTHYGCTDVNSPNFDYNANVDDNNCQPPLNYYNFGAGYMTCTSLSKDAGDLCVNFTVKNPLTGDFRCQDGYQPIPLTNNTLSRDVKHTHTSEKCSGWWLWESCNPVYHHSIKYSRAFNQGFWCVLKAKPKNNTGVMFGGLFTSWMNNSVTGDKSCPVAYVPLRLATDLYVCVSSAYDIGSRYSAPFGGFFSCQNGNPLTTKLNLFTTNGGVYIRGCPDGYSQRLIVIENGCEINFCVKFESAVSKIDSCIVLPPFGE